MENLNENVIAEQKPGQEAGVNSLVLASGPEAEKITQNLNVLYESLIGNEPVTAGILSALRQSLGNMKISVSGEEFSLSELRNIDIKKNLEIIEEVESGNFSNIRSLTFLTPGMARILVSKSNGVRAALPLDGLSKISDEVVEILSSFDGELHLNHLSPLSVQAARSLANHVGHQLWLLNLDNPSEEVLRALVPYEGYLALGLTTLSESEARILVDQKRSLGLNRLTEISDSVADILSQHGDHLDLRGLNTLSRPAAKSLSLHKGNIYVNEALKRSLPHYYANFMD